MTKAKMTPKAKASLKGVVKQAGQQLVTEPLEILKTAKTQVIDKERGGAKKETPPGVDAGQQVSTPPDEQKLKAQSQRLLKALEAEIEDIRRQKQAKEAQELKEEEAQLQADERKELIKPLAEVSGKQPRKIIRGMKGKLAKLKKKAERLPPSG